MKLVELPSGTIVDFEADGYYEKRDDGNWYATTGHCVDCMEDDVIEADSIDEDPIVSMYSIRKGQPHRKYTIISMPYSIVMELTHQLAEMYHVVGLSDTISINGLIRDAVEAVKQKESEKKS